MPIDIDGKILNDILSREIEYNSIIQEGLVCHLDGSIYETISGTTWYDLSGNSNEGTLTNGSGTSTSNKGIVTFDGVDDYVDVGAISGDFSNFTVCIWFYPTSVTNYENAIDCNYGYNGTTGNIGPRLEMNSSGTLGWVFSGETDSNNEFQYVELLSSGLTQNSWHFAALSRSSTNSVISYLDGSVSSTSITSINGTVSTQFVNVFNNVIIGKGFHLGGGERIFSGNVGVVLIYNRSLTSSELTHNFNILKKRYGL